MHEANQHTEPTLTELTGRHFDAAAFYLSLIPHLAHRGISLAEYARQQLMLRSDLVAKVTKYGERTPTAPYLGEVSHRLGRVLFMGEECSQDQLAELLVHFRYEVGDAEEYFKG